MKSTPADWHANPAPELAEVLDRMTRDGLIGWRGRVGSPQRRPFIRSYGRTAVAALQVLLEDELRRNDEGDE